MLARAAAILLIALGLTPFTAPFSTCDFATFSGTAPEPHDVAKASLADPSATARVTPMVNAAGRVRLAALRDAPRAGVPGMLLPGVQGALALPELHLPLPDSATILRV